MKKNNSTKGKIINAAWKLFYEIGYEDTTVEAIIYESKTSKGSFYHYFEGKDSLLSSLSYVFDEQYEKLQAQIDDTKNSFDVLIWLNHELFSMIEDSISIDLLSRLLSTQLITKGEKHLLDRGRLYYKLLQKIISDGQKKGELRSDMSAHELVKLYAMCERSLMYEWCLANGDYSLKENASKLMPMLLSKIRS